MADVQDQVTVTELYNDALSSLQFWEGVFLRENKELETAVLKEAPVFEIKRLQRRANESRKKFEHKREVVDGIFFAVAGAIRKKFDGHLQGTLFGKAY